MVRMGDSLGLYKTLHAKGPMTVEEFAAAADVNQRYRREWASHQAASKYLTYDSAAQKFSLSEEQAMVFAIDDSPFNMLGAFDATVAIIGNQDKVEPPSGTAEASAGATRAPVCLAPARVSFVPVTKRT
jgi:hypothetical protein